MADHCPGCDTSPWTDDLWVVDSTPVECGRSRETARRSDLAGYAEYGYGASQSRFFWGLRLHLIATLDGLPMGFALTGAKADGRHVVVSVLTADPSLLTGRHRQVMIADKNYYGREFEATISSAGIELLRPARKGEPTPARGLVLPAAAHPIESIFDTAKGQLDLEGHGRHTITGVAVRVYQRLLALTAAIWHNDHTGQPVKRSLLAHDH